VRAVLFEETPEEFARVDIAFRAGADSAMQIRSLALPRARPKAWPELDEEQCPLARKARPQAGRPRPSQEKNVLWVDWQSAWDLNTRYRSMSRGACSGVPMRTFGISGENAGMQEMVDQARCATWRRSASLFRPKSSVLQPKSAVLRPKSAVKSPVRKKTISLQWLTHTAHPVA
jgi:hypothetical protein